MARKTIDFSASVGRDKGKVFRITEMPASQAEKWAAKVFLAMGQSGVEIPDNVAALGLVGLVSYGDNSLIKISFPLAEPILDEMMECVQIIPNPSNPNIIRKLMEEDIEEVLTRFMLRKEIMRLHTDFFEDGDLPTTESDRQTSTPQSSSTIKTRPFSSPRRSQPK